MIECNKLVHARHDSAALRAQIDRLVFRRKSLSKTYNVLTLQLATSANVCGPTIGNESAPKIIVNDTIFFFLNFFFLNCNQHFGSSKFKP